MDTSLRDLLKTGKQKEFISAIKKEGLNLNAVDENGDTLLHYAAHFSSYGIDALKALLDQKADANVQNTNKVTPLLTAVLFGTLDAVKVFVQFVPLLINVADTVGETVLLRAVNDKGKKDNKKISAFLKRKDMDLELRDKQGWTALQYAVSNQDYEVVKLLLKKGAKIDVKDPSSGNSLLFTPIIKKDLKMLELLLYWKVPTDLANNNKDTPLHLSSYHGDEYIDFTKKMAAKNSKTCLQKGNNEQTPLHLAVGAAKGELTIKTLTYYGKSAKDALDGAGKKPKDVAIESGKTNLVQLL